MNISVIDIGSNTVKMTVFTINNNQSFKNIHMQKFPAKLLSCIVDGNLSNEGIEKLINALGNFKKTATFYGCEKILCFSTNVLRVAKNADEVLSRVKNETGFWIDIITGESEAYYSFMGLRYSLISSKNSAVSKGVMVDLGGGSTEILYFNDNEIKSAVSLPFGCLYLADRFVSQTIPSPKERENIIYFVKETLSVSDNLPPFCETENVPAFLIGGTSQALAALYCYVADSEYEYKNFTLGADTADKILDHFFSEPDAEALIQKLLPDRVRTVLPGVTAYSVILRHLGCGEINIADAGIREGYLFTHIE